MTKYFHKLSVTSTIRSDLIDICRDSTPWIDPDVGTFLQKRVPKNLFDREPFLKYLGENYLMYQFEYSVNIFMLKPWTHYKLHTDRHRPCSINLLINDYADSISYFQVSEFHKAQCSVLELQYEPNYYYLFNSQIPHAMINKAEERYLLSISLKYDYDLMHQHLSNQFFL
jgi:hypothetical protein